jgi:hypothetical protein
MLITAYMLIVLRMKQLNIILFWRGDWDFTEIYFRNCVAMFI